MNDGFKYGRPQDLLTEVVKQQLLKQGLAPVIAIDGPSGSGKSSVARQLALELGLLYIDTGAMFRALAYLAQREQVPFNAGGPMQKFLAQVQMEYVGRPERLILCQGEDLTHKIREHQVSSWASVISQLGPVRDFLLKFQRDLARQEFCVMEGRDIGTVVFPKAFCKFFVTASVEIRAERRLNELQTKGQDQVSLAQIIEDVKRRDETDMQRAVAPLKQASDAELIDTTGLNLNEVVAVLVAQLAQRVQKL